ncbi:MAG: branched-chain amino acid transaminase [Chloroflexota bacterium]
MTNWVYMDGKYVPLEEAKISITTHAFLYGTACFEGIRAYWNAEKEQLYVFRPREHYERLADSCRILGIALPHTVDELCRITVELFQKNQFRQNIHFRPFAYKSKEKSGQISLDMRNVGDAFFIWAQPFGKYIQTKGAKCCISSWRQTDDNSISRRAKISAAYILSALARSEAGHNGYDEAILLNQDGHVSEGSGENLFMVRKGKLTTPAVTENLLEGITRATVIEIAEAELGIKTVERAVDRTELYAAQELFFCGTGAEITPIVQVDGRTIGTGEVGPLTQKISDLYFDIVYGRNPKYSRWLTPVYAK